MTADDRTHRASKLIPAEPHAIYQALVDPKALVRWLPPEGATGRIAVFEPRPGGRYRITLTFAAHPGKSTTDSDEVEGRFIELVPDRRVVQTGIFHSDDPAFAGEMTMTWELLPEAGGTRVRVTATDVPAGISKKDHEEGIASSLAHLARFVE